MPTVECPHCATRLAVDDAWMGREVECGSCGRRMAVPAADDDDRPRPRRRPRDDDDDDDDDDDRPRRRRRSGRRWALDRVRGPATGLQVVGWMGIAFSAIGFVRTVVFVIAAPKPPGGDATVWALAQLAGAVAGIAVGTIIVIGAGHLKRLDNLGMATAAAGLAMVPCLSPCCLLGLPFGIRALQALNDLDVRREFR